MLIFHFTESFGQEKAICECDKLLSETFLSIKNNNGGQLDLSNGEFAAENCSHSANNVAGELFCCEKATGSYSMYNNGRFCCEDFALHSIGSCENEDGLKFNHSIPIV